MKRKFAAKAVSSWIHNWYRNTIRHPKYRWLLIVGSLVYLLNPFDLAPDILPVVGLIDDGLVATVLVAEVSQLLRDRIQAQKVKTSVAANSSGATIVDISAVPVS